MSNERLILCGGIHRPHESSGIKPVHLHLWGKQENIKLKITDISRPIVANIPSLLIDLLEIATYIYCADQATTRGGEGVQNLGAKWRRHFQFHIPVRYPDVWSSSSISSLLRDTLGFLSDDDYLFTFYHLKNPPSTELYFDFGPGGATGFSPQSVILFSGGLDSLAGVVEEAVINSHPVVLVSHRSSPKIASNFKFLVPALQSHCQVRLLHVPIWINKEKELGKEYTQRTRSFLYASLGAVVARIFGLWGIKFYENGVISLNLPISAQLIGARATRTTHPQVLNGFTQLFSQLFEREFKVENPFIWKTKTDIVRIIVSANCGDLIKHTISCTRTWEQTKLQTHCGRCSQCIDRRFAILASGYDVHDPKEMYKIDLLTDEHQDGIDKTMVESYVRTSSEINKMGDDDKEFFSRFGEVTRVIGHLHDYGTVPEIAANILDLHKRHARDVCNVLDNAVAQHASDIREGSLPESCAIALTLHDRYRQLKKPVKRHMDKFPTPVGACWKEIKMKFTDGYTVSVTVRDIKNRPVSYEAMGMADHRKSKPNKQWHLLESFAEGYGNLTWNHPDAHRRNQKQREILAKNLREFFGIDGDPIEYVAETKGWKTLFEIEPESQS